LSGEVFGELLAVVKLSTKIWVGRGNGLYPLYVVCIGEHEFKIGYGSSKMFAGSGEPTDWLWVCWPGVAPAEVVIYTMGLFAW